MATKIVNDTAGLLAAVKAAKSGDVIKLEEGRYDGVVLKNLQLDNVIIESNNPNKPAVFTELLVRDSSGLTFRNLEFFVDPAKPQYSYTVDGSKNIKFDSVNVHGTLDGTPQDEKYGMMIRQSENITVTNSEFHHLYTAISHLDVEGLTFTNNRFHDLRDDGIRGGGSSDVLVKGNSFTDFFPVLGDHPDAIQFWTRGETKTAGNIVVTENVITAGKGGAVQGIFFRDQGDSLPYQNVTITKNLMIGGMYNGLFVDGADGLLVKDNIIIGLPGQEARIRFENVTNGNVSNNLATLYIYGPGSSDIDTSGNFQVPIAPESSKAHFLAWLGKVGGSLGSLSSSLAEIYADLPGSASTPAPKAQPAPPPGSGSGGSGSGPGPKPIFGDQQGTAGNDILSVIGEGGVKLFGHGGNDTLNGGDGANQLIGGTGDDNYRIKDADDLVIEAAGAGTDTVWASVNYTLTNDVEILRMVDDARIGTGNGLDNRIYGSTGNDKIYGLGGADKIYGGTGVDMIYGGDGHDELSGDADADRLDGGEGNDRLFGGTGGDYLTGGTGADYLEGGAGADTMSGGLGADQFNFRPEDIAAGVIDRIEDFSSAQGDRILLSLLDANLNTAMNDKFAFIGTQAFSKVAGQLRYEVKGKDAYVHGDMNGDGVADFTIRIVGVTTLVAGDFML